MEWLFADAVEEGVVRSNPTSGVRATIRLADDVGEAPTKALTRAQLRRLLDELPDDRRLFFEFLAHTGLRISEAIEVRWHTDLDLGERPRLRVSRQLRSGRPTRPKSRPGPGRFPGIVDLTDPRVAPRFARNPRIARVCSDLHFGQELGEGIRRIFEEMHLAGLQEPRYNQSAASVRLTLSGEPVQAALDEAFTPDARAVSGALRDAGRLSTGEVAELLGRSRPHALKVLNSLREAGLIRRIGKSPKDPRAYWEIVPR
jgi:CRP-like cAMP-binding protein